MVITMKPEICVLPDIARVVSGVQISNVVDYTEEHILVVAKRIIYRRLVLYIFYVF